MGGGTFWGLGSILTKAKVYYMSILDPREYMVIYLCDRTRLLALHLQLSSRRLQFLPAATKLGQGNIFTGVCLSTGGEKGCLPQCMLGYTPPDQADPPGKQTSAYGQRAAGTHPTGMHSSWNMNRTRCCVNTFA